MKSMTGTGVFDRGGYSSMSDRAFMGLIACFVGWGLFMTHLMATYFAPSDPGLWFLLIVGIVIPICGVFISVSDNAFLSFLGYNMITIPLGLCMGWISRYADDVVHNAVMMTLIITVIMGFAGVIFPNFFKSIGGFLFYSLLALVFVRILQIFIPSLQHLSIIDYIAAGIFSLYIGYDMYRASTIGRTLLNALHVSVSLYLDIINLFTSLLSSND